MSSGDSCAAKGAGFWVLMGRFWAPACRRPGLPSRSWVRSGAGMGCLRKSVADACHPVTAILVMPGSGTIPAVWMPGLWRCPGTVWASGGLPKWRFALRLRFRKPKYIGALVASVFPSVH